MDKLGVPYTIDHLPLHMARKRRPGTVRKPRTITIHSTANPTSRAANERKWLANPNNKADYVGWHVCVDQAGAIEAIPPTEVAWHAGDGGTGPGNAYSIGVEICESGDRAKTLLNAAKVVAVLLREHGLTTADLRQHNDWNGKNCPRILREGNKWQEFKVAVEAWYNMAGSSPLTLEAAVKVLAEAGIVNSPQYWLDNAQAGKTVKGDYVATVILRTAAKLKGVK